MVSPLAAIRPVLGADDRTHLVYELLLINQSAFVVAIDSVVVLRSDDGAVLLELTGESLARALRLKLFGGKGTTLEPSQSAFVFIDAVVAAGEAIPATLLHRISTTQTMPATEVSAELGGLTVKPDIGVAPNVTFTLAPVPVEAAGAVVLGPPVHGANWVMFRGCCDVSTSHRGGTGSYDGVMYVPERFAIDFVQLGAADHLITGADNELGSYPQYSQPVYAVADGVVVSARNGEPDQVPGALPEGISADAAGGNAVLIDIGNDRFAFYAHMKPGSVHVSPGDSVKSGDEIGLIGNSGKTIAPHLHFHLVDGPSPIAADGLPFVFASFTGQGVLAENALLLAFQGESAPINRVKLAGPHWNHHPLNNQVADFGK